MSGGSGSTATVSLTTAFIDLSTYDEIECWLYGGKSVNKFRKVIRKSAWFTVIAAQLNRCGTVGDFGTEMQAMFSRAGDYIRDVWLRVELPEIRTTAPFQARWTKNIGHNLIEEAYLHFNDLAVNKLTSFHLDFLHAFMTPPGKENGYQNMIGNISPLVNPYAEYYGLDAIRGGDGAGGTVPAQVVPLPRSVLNIPLPFYFTHDPSDSIIQAACPFNDVRVTIKFRNWEDLLIFDKVGTTIDMTVGETGVLKVGRQAGSNGALVTPQEALEPGLIPRLLCPQVWAHYAVIPNGDREKIGEESDIDVVISQVQTIPPVSYNPASQGSRGVDLRFAHSIRAIFFAMRNSTLRNEWSNYSTHVPRGGGARENEPALNMKPVGSGNPIERAVLTYENVDRVNMSADYYTLVAPWYSAVSIPHDTGYHLLSYANRLDCLQPDGSTNFARLASVNLNIFPTLLAQAQSAATPASFATLNQWSPEWKLEPARFDIIITASSISILRFSSGSAGFPIL